MFLVNSRRFLFNVNQFFIGHSFSRSYRVNLQSSLHIILLIVLIYYIHPPVSVYSTVYLQKSFFQRRFLFKVFTSVTFLKFPLTYTVVICLRVRFILTMSSRGLETLGFRRQCYSLFPLLIPICLLQISP